VDAARQADTIRSSLRPSRLGGRVSNCTTDLPLKPSDEDLGGSTEPIG